jgi:phosphatidylethanolamine-binding protein (PEBP) family uncharacterized protein
MNFIPHLRRSAFLAAGLCAAACICAAQTNSLNFRLKSPVIRNNGGVLPQEFTCDGDSSQPPFTWTDPPAGTRSFAMTMHHLPPDDEAKHVYIVLYNIPANVRELPKNSKDIGVWGQNSMRRRTGYTPPCSGGGGLKIYTATLYALSTPPDLKFDGVAPGMVTMDQLMDAIEGKIIARTYLDVTYVRGALAPNGNGRGGGAPGAAGQGGPGGGGRGPGGRGGQGGGQGNGGQGNGGQPPNPPASPAN